VKTKSEYTKEEYVKELVSLWEDAVRVVYLKQPTNYGDELAQRAWDGTNIWLLFEYQFAPIGSNSHYTNRL
jgi:hypothetical protein